MFLDKLYQDLNLAGGKPEQRGNFKLNSNGNGWHTLILGDKLVDKCSDEEVLCSIKQLCPWSTVDTGIIPVLAEKEYNVRSGVDLIGIGVECNKNTIQYVKWPELVKALFGKDVKNMTNNGDLAVPTKEILAYRFINNTPFNIELDRYAVKPKEVFWVHRRYANNVELAMSKKGMEMKEPRLVGALQQLSVISTGLNKLNLRVTPIELKEVVSGTSQVKPEYAELFKNEFMVEGRENIRLPEEQIISETYSIKSKVTYKNKVLGYLIAKKTKAGEAILLYDKENTIKWLKKVPEQSRNGFHIKSAYGNDYIDCECSTIDLGNNVRDITGMSNERVKEMIIRKVTYEWRKVLPESYYK